MKQISPELAAKLATANKGQLAQETRWAREDWIKENARYIAAIESKEWDKTLGGEWPKGWRAEMKKEAAAVAAKSMLDRFLRDECKLLDGAIWLGNWQMIQQLEKSERGVSRNGPLRVGAVQIGNRES